MTSDLARALAGNFVVANLGSGGDKDYDLPERFRRAMTVIEIDAGTQSKMGDRYHARFATSSVIAGAPGKEIFRMRRYPFCSSVALPREERVAEYGLGRHFEEVGRTEVECVTLPELMKGWGIAAVDFLKTDLEGIDYQVIRSLDDSLDSVLAIQCELRFQPFYEGEPFFHEVSSYLHGRGFELVGMHPYYWKPKGPHQESHREGRVTLADCVFIRAMDSVARLPEAARNLARAKQILISGMAGLVCHADFLFESYRASLPAAWVEDLKDFVKPRPKSFRGGAMWRIAARLYHRVKKSPGFDFSHYVNNGEW